MDEIGTAIGQQNNGRQYGFTGNMQGNELSRNISRMQDKPTKAASLTTDLNSIISKSFKIVGNEMQFSDDAMKRVATDHKLQFIEKSDAIYANQDISDDDKKIQISKVFSDLQNSSAKTISDNSRLQEIYDTGFTDKVRPVFSNAMAKLDISINKRLLDSELNNANHMTEVDPLGTTYAELKDIVGNNIKQGTIQEDKISSSLLSKKGVKLVDMFSTDRGVLLDKNGNINKKLLSSTYSDFLTVDKDGNISYNKSNTDIQTQTIKNTIADVNTLINKEKSAINTQMDKDTTALIGALGTPFSSVEKIGDLESLLKEVRGDKPLTLAQSISLQKNISEYNLNNVSTENMLYRMNPTNTNMSGAMSSISNDKQEKVLRFHSDNILSIEKKEDFNKTISLMIENGNDRLVSKVASSVVLNTMSTNTTAGYNQYKKQSVVFKNSTALATATAGMSPQESAEFISRITIYDNDMANGLENTTLTPEMASSIKAILKTGNKIQLEKKFMENELYSETMDSLVGKPMSYQRDVRNISFAISASGRPDLIKQAVDSYKSRFHETDNGAMVEITADDKERSQDKYSPIEDTTSSLIRYKKFSEDTRQDFEIKNQIKNGMYSLMIDKNGGVGAKLLTVYDSNGNSILSDSKINTKEYLSKTVNPSSYDRIDKSIDNFIINSGDIFKSEEYSGTTDGNSDTINMINQSILTEAGTNVKEFSNGTKNTPMKNTKLKDSTLNTARDLVKDIGDTTDNLFDAIIDLGNEKTTVEDITTSKYIEDIAVQSLNANNKQLDIIFKSNMEDTTLSSFLLKKDTSSYEHISDKINEIAPMLKMTPEKAKKLDVSNDEFKKYREKIMLEYIEKNNINVKIVDGIFQANNDIGRDITQARLDNTIRTGRDDLQL